MPHLLDDLITTQTCSWELKATSLKPPAFRFSWSVPDPTQVVLHMLLWCPWATEVSKRYPRGPSSAGSLAPIILTGSPSSVSSRRKSGERELLFMFNRKRHQANKNGCRKPVVKTDTFSSIIEHNFAVWQISHTPVAGLIRSHYRPM